MISLFRPADVQAMDQRAFGRGVDPAALMDHAAYHLAAGVLHLADHNGLARHGLRVRLVCGKGNNGADGLAAARHLRKRGVEATCVLVVDEAELNDEGEREAAALRRARGRIVEATTDAALAEALRDAAIVVDCLLGTGASGAPRGIYADAVTAINDARDDRGCLVVACDLPTGVDAATGGIPGAAVQADLTVTLGAHKTGLWLHPAARAVGRLVLGEIGVIDEEAVSDARMLEAEDLHLLFPPPGPRADKRSRGVVVIFAGSRDMAGAALLSARGALGAGAGLVTIVTPSAVAHRIAGMVPEVMTVGLPDGVDAMVDAILDTAGPADVLAIGPGLGLDEDTQTVIRQVVARADTHVVLDADGINAFRDHTDDLVASGQDRPSDRHLVLTPHANELGRLAGLSGDEVSDRRTEVAVEQAARCNATVLAKGPRTVIAGPAGDIWINQTGGPALATGGTGDVLTGITAALLAQNHGRLTAGSAAAAVVAAAHLHGLAGDHAARHQSARSTTAGTVADHLPPACQELGL